MGRFPCGDSDMMMYKTVLKTDGKEFSAQDTTPFKSFMKVKRECVANKCKSGRVIYVTLFLDDVMIFKVFGMNIKTASDEFRRNCVRMR